jgi:hypothetical protein
MRPQILIFFTPQNKFKIGSKSLLMLRTVQRGSEHHTNFNMGQIKIWYSNGRPVFKCPVHIPILVLLSRGWSIFGCYLVLPLINGQLSLVFKRLVL